MGGPPLHEFLPEGMMPDFPDLRDPVRTPWRFRNGAWMDCVCEIWNFLLGKNSFLAFHVAVGVVVSVVVVPFLLSWFLYIAI